MVKIQKYLAHRKDVISGHLTASPYGRSVDTQSDEVDFNRSDVPDEISWCY
jgi:hypothetical protein